MRRKPSLLLALPLLLALTACQTVLYTGLSERDAMQMVAILLQHGITADRVIAKDGTSTVEVPGASVSDAVMVLHAAHYPRNEYADTGKVFQQQGLIATPGAERAKLYYGISQELEHTLNDIDGVVDARVHIAPAVNDPVTGEDRPATAAVVLRYDAGTAMDGLLPKIKLLVANAVQDLTYEHVSVILLPVQPPALPPAPVRGFGPWAVIGWVLAIFWPAAGGGWYLWTRRRRQHGRPAAHAVSLVPDRDRVSDAA
jgi:type III secretion protein J